MRWKKYGSSHDLACTQITQEELLDFKRKAEAFLLSCRSRYPGVSKDLGDPLLALVDQLVPGENNWLPFRYSSYKRLLRWAITDGKQFQDHRRDNARALWHSLFRGSIPSFIQWNTMSHSYDEYPEELRTWIESLVADAAAPAEAA